MKEHLYFLGIGGTLMGSLALLAKEMGFHVSGSDKVLYPPMSDLLKVANIEVFEGFSPEQLEPRPAQVIVGNAGLPRGHEAIEHILNAGLSYVSGAEWLGTTVLRDRWVLAVAGTHGKTTTASMLAWILDYAGLKPGYLIGGAPGNFDQSARLGETPFFVVEADEYDTSYFDRRAKFVHYRPRTLILNNLEYDHADIFPDLASIQAQFHLLLRSVPSEGLIIAPAQDEAVSEVVEAGCWTPIEHIGQAGSIRSLNRRAQTAALAGSTWSFRSAPTDPGSFEVYLNEECLGNIKWSLMGEHNQMNALNAIAAARHVGVIPEVALEALTKFQGVKRRMEKIYDDGQTAVYDDFAHHPTAIRNTLEGIRKRHVSDEIVAVIEPRTHTMSLGALRSQLTTCCAAADQVIWFRGENIKWDLQEVVNNSVVDASILNDIDKLIAAIVESRPAQGVPKRHVVIMSNGGFGGVHVRLVEALASSQASPSPGGPSPGGPSPGGP